MPPSIQKDYTINPWDQLLSDVARARACRSMSWQVQHSGLNSALLAGHPGRHPALWSVVRESALVWFVQWIGEIAALRSP